MDNRLTNIFGPVFKAEACKMKEFRRGGVLIVETIITEFKPGQSMLFWLRQPINEKYIEGFENAVISCRFKQGDAVDEDQARGKAARRFDDYWKVIADLGPAEERHSITTAEERKRLQ